MHAEIARSVKSKKVRGESARLNALITSGIEVLLQLDRGPITVGKALSPLQQLLGALT